MRFSVVLFLALNAACQEAFDHFEQTPGDFDSSIAIETVFRKEWTAAKVEAWFDHFQILPSLGESNMPVHSLFYDKDKSHVNMIFSSACVLYNYMDEVFSYASSSPFVTTHIYGKVPSQLSTTINRTFPGF